MAASSRFGTLKVCRFNSDFLIIVETTYHLFLLMDCWTTMCFLDLVFLCVFGVTMLQLNQRVGNCTCFCCFFAICRVEMGVDAVFPILRYAISLLMPCPWCYAVNLLIQFLPCSWCYALNLFMYTVNPQDERPNLFPEIGFHVSIWDDWQDQQYNHIICFSHLPVRSSPGCFSSALWTPMAVFVPGP